ncbi:MAG: hypothetical protein Q8Q89_02380 [bacterium]|nr:hypothetical protein [bacterium]
MKRIDLLFEKHPVKLTILFFLLYFFIPIVYVHSKIIVTHEIDSSRGHQTVQVMNNGSVWISGSPLPVELYEKKDGQVYAIYTNRIARFVVLATPDQISIFKKFHQ